MTPESVQARIGQIHDLRAEMEPTLRRSFHGANAELRSTYRALGDELDALKVLWTTLVMAQYNPVTTVWTAVL